MADCNCVPSAQCRGGRRPAVHAACQTQAHRHTQAHRPDSCSSHAGERRRPRAAVRVLTNRRQPVGWDSNHFWRRTQDGPQERAQTSRRLSNEWWSLRPRSRLFSQQELRDHQTGEPSVPACQSPCISQGRRLPRRVVVGCFAVCHDGPSALTRCDALTGALPTREPGIRSPCRCYRRSRRPETRCKCPFSSPVTRWVVARRRFSLPPALPHATQNISCTHSDVDARVKCTKHPIHMHVFDFARGRTCELISGGES